MSSVLQGVFILRDILDGLTAFSSSCDFFPSALKVLIKRLCTSLT
jgi:hypothetical protein